MPDPATVELSDDSVVTIEVEGEEPVVETPSGAPAAPANGQTAATVAPAVKDAADEAAAALLEAQGKIEAERRRADAATATANAERQRAERAQRLAAQREQEAAEARDAVGSTELTLVTNGIDNSTRALASAKAELKRAFDAGDADKMADAQEQIAGAAAELKDYSRRKTEIEAGATRRAPPASGAVEAPQAVTEPFEAYLANGNFSPAAQNWLRGHRECAPTEVGGDATKNAAMMQGHWAALGKNIRPDTPEYFQVIEQHLQPAVTSAAATVQPAAGGDGSAAPAAPAAKPAAKKTPTPAAPPTNAPPSAGGAPAQRRSVQLNPAQQETALFSYPAKPGEDEAAHRKRAFGTYAQELVKATAEGKIGRIGY